MFFVLLRFSDKKNQASEFMEGHNRWIKQGFDDGVFLLAGSLQDGKGGAIIAHGVSPEGLQNRINEDPFVAKNIVTSEIVEVDPKKMDDRLHFLLD